MAMQQGEPPVVAGIAQRGDHAPGQFARGAPDDVVARHRIALAIAPALDPVDRRHEADAVRQQPVVHLGARMLDVMARPLHGVGVCGIQLAEAHPVGEGALGRVGDLLFFLQRGADQRHPAERPLCQPAEAFRAVAVHKYHALAGAQQFQRGDDAGQAAADHHCIGLHNSHSDHLSRCCPRLLIALRST